LFRWRFINTAHFKRSAERLDVQGELYQLNNSVTFSGKLVWSEEFLNQMVEALGIIIDRGPKERACKRES